MNKQFFDVLLFVGSSWWLLMVAGCFVLTATLLGYHFAIVK
jgi:hypothetical protein